MTHGGLVTVPAVNVVGRGVDSWYIVKVQPRECVDGWDVRTERNRVKDDCKALGWRNWKNGAAQLRWGNRGTSRVQRTD